MTRGPQTQADASVSPGHPLFEIIDDAYRTFDSPKPGSTGVCERCCMDAAIEDDFFNPPIRRLPLAYVQDWYCAAYDPEKGVPKETWVYLLPRILEILAAGEEPANVGTEIVLSRFQTGRPENWTSEEWKVLDRFQRRYLAREIQSGIIQLDDVICMFYLAGWDLEDLLDQVSSTPDAVLAERLWQDWCKGRCPGDGRIWTTAFWKSPGNSLVFEFYTSQALYDRMAACALAHDTPPELAAKASAVVCVIEASR